MKKFLMMAAFAVLFAAPSFAEEAAVAPAVDAVVTTEVAVPTTEGPAVETAAAVDVAAATEACTSETNEKVKLPENAGDAEKAQWDAALAECLKGKGVEETAAPAAVETTTTVETEATVDTTTEAPAAE